MRDETPAERPPATALAARGAARGPLEPGLHLIATPIGAARDITLRALDILAKADVLAAEDTRSLRHLMEIHGVPLAGRPLLAYHDHNGPAMRPRLLAALAEGRSVAYASEAGTPLVADPGYQLARAAVAAGHTLRAAPGPSAVLAALAVSGLPSDRFLFAGFPPATAAARAAFLAEMAEVQATVILFESPRRISRTLMELREAFGAGREAVVCRELTKRFEEVTRGTLGTLADAFSTGTVKGEIVLLIGRPPPVTVAEDDIDDALRTALLQVSVKAAAAEVSASLGLPRREVYQRALRIAGKGRD
ncbi:MAG: 16S rRNA (cytidine(1402)-2'-O)-methyltransferase [Gemmobacter sp.]